MRSSFFFLALTAAMLLAGQAAVQAADTAYSALQVVLKKLGKDSINQIVEVKGRYGTPEPPLWKITVLSDRAPSGVRELEVQRGRVVADRTPTRGAVGNPMDFNRLNLDSEGVFTLVNQEAEKAKVPFDRVDYTLTAGTRGGAPVWRISLWDGRNGQVGRYDIAADNGNILSGGFDNGRNRPLPPPAAPPLTQDRYRDDRYQDDRYRDEDRSILEEEEERAYRERDRDRDYSGRRSSGGGFIGKVERHFERRGRQIKKFFNGDYFR